MDSMPMATPTVPALTYFIGGETDTRGTAQLALNTWTHLAATYDGSVLRRVCEWRAGQHPHHRRQYSDLNFAAAHRRRFLCRRVFSGLIDEVRIYNRALTATEIQTDMNTAIGGTPPPPDTTPPTVSVTAPAMGRRWQAQ